MQFKIALTAGVTLLITLLSETMVAILRLFFLQFVEERVFVSLSAQIWIARRRQCQKDGNNNPVLEKRNILILS
jgi:hypothetical protein